MANTYKRYKQGTYAFTQWLVHTAKATSKFNDLLIAFTKATPSTTSGRLKGKAKIAAKKLGLPKNNARLAIPIKHFLSLAHAIADAKNVEVPSHVLSVLRAVVRGRTKCAQWYLGNQKNPSAEIQDNNDRHAHFIKTLSDVYDMLSAKHAKTPRRKSDTDKEGTTVINNMFERLDLQRTSDEDDLANFAMAVLPGDQRYELESTQADTAFAVYCFLRDVTHLRLYVRRTWREWKQGKITLQTALLTMNAALEMIRNASDEFKNAFPQFMGNDELPMHALIGTFVYEGYCTDPSKGQFIDGHVQENDPFAYREDGQVLRSETVLCTQTMDMLLCFIPKPRYAHPKLSQDERRFLKCLCQLAALTINRQHSQYLTHSDFVYKAMEEYLTTRSLDTWAVLAMQILWHTQRELGDVLQIPEQMLKEGARSLVQNYTKYINFDGIEIIGVWHKPGLKLAQQQVKLYRELFLENIFQKGLDQLEEQAAWKFSQLNDFQLLQCHPSLCGIWLSQMFDQYHRHCINMASDQGQILVVAHLYNAAKSSKALSEDDCWADLDWFIEKQGVEWIYGGTSPASKAEYRGRLRQVMGLKGGTNVYGMNRRLEYLVIYSELDTDRSGNRLKKVTLKPNMFEVSLARIETLAGTVMTGKQKKRPMSVTFVLDKFKEAMELDIGLYSFDFLGLYLRCVKLLRDFQVHCINHAPLDFPASECSGGLNGRSGLGMNTVIDGLLENLRSDVRLHRSMFPDAVRMMRKVIEAQGGAALNEMKERNKKVGNRAINTTSDKEPRFEAPYEDVMSQSMRQLFDNCIFADENGNWRIPFGLS